MTVTPVGYVRSELKTPSLTAKGEDIELEKGLQQAATEAKDIRSLVSELVINAELDGILDGLEDFSHALVLYWPHLLPSQGRSLIKVHPIGQKRFPLVGVFSTCSPARPNPILVTTVRIIEKKGNILKVQGLEAVDNSPVIDIKPYTMTYCSAEDVRVSDWMDQIQQTMSQT
ncbi:MAG: tRNA (N6-threonylcarbamoyladenosine(37)-N6)-methyltransferase TrmO [Deltaproteobacteria bacterium]|nr:tRNA (N6-threonylcarbamoyladenosine(37)-N6)-methyltransferase TrmO [Deltaproteobacteria bacterium]